MKTKMTGKTHFCLSTSPLPSSLV